MSKRTVSKPIKGAKANRTRESYSRKKTAPALEKLPLADRGGHPEPNLEAFDQHIARIRGILDGLQDRIQESADAMGATMMHHCDTRSPSSIRLARTLQREALAGMLAYHELATLAGELLGRADSLYGIEGDLGVLSPAGEQAVRSEVTP